MSDVLDTLDWKPWPKDREWVFADILGVARVGKQVDRSDGITRYFVRALDEDGALGAWHYTNVERDEAVTILNKAIEALKLALS